MLRLDELDARVNELKESILVIDNSLLGMVRLQSQYEILSLYFGFYHRTQLKCSSFGVKMRFGSSVQFFRSVGQSTVRLGLYVDEHEVEKGFQRRVDFANIHHLLLEVC